MMWLLNNYYSCPRLHLYVHSLVYLSSFESYDKSFIHSWVTGYFPHDEPKYAFAFVLDHGPRGEETGAVSAAYEVFPWLEKQRPEYVR